MGEDVKWLLAGIVLMVIPAVALGFASLADWIISKLKPITGKESE